MRGDGGDITVVVRKELLLDALGHGGLATVAADGDSGHCDGWLLFDLSQDVKKSVARRCAGGIKCQALNFWGILKVNEAGRH
jgi:hypothetical protein